MKRNRWMSIVVAVGLLGILVLWIPASRGQAQAPAASPRIVWEYKTEIRQDISGFDANVLNNWGQEGWELAGITSQSSRPTFVTVLWVFKRPKP